MSSLTKIRCRAVIIHEDRLLVVKHRVGDTFVALPGGGLEFGETPSECLRREIIEELGIAPEIGRLLYVNSFLPTPEIQSIEFFFAVTNSSAYLSLEGLERTHAHELVEIIWIDRHSELLILPAGFGADFKKGTIDLSMTKCIND